MDTDYLRRFLSDTSKSRKRNEIRELLDLSGRAFLGKDDVVPDFQNPGGVTLSIERRHELLSIAREFDMLVIETAPTGNCATSESRSPDWVVSIATAGSSRSTPSAISWRPDCASAGPLPIRRSSPS